MLKIGNCRIDIDYFNDGTLRLTDLPFNNANAITMFAGKLVTPTIVWQYENIVEQIALQNIVCHLRDVFGIDEINLFVPYLPNARMDRTERRATEVHTLKWFARFINDLHFAKVFVLDVHSAVSAALLDRVVELPVQPMIARAIEQHQAEVLVFPDSGAMKRYHPVIKALGMPYSYFEKERDWATRKITGVTMVVNDTTKNARVLVVDDIIAEGNTMVKIYDDLRRGWYEGSDIALYCSHLEPTAFRNQRLWELYSNVYTTDSIVRELHKQVTTFRLLGENGYAGWLV